MLLDFDDIQDVSNEEIQDNVKGKAKVCDEDLSKPFKEVLKCPFTRIIVEFSSPGHRMPANAKIYDGTECSSEPSMARQGHGSKNSHQAASKTGEERCVSESNAIPNVPELMQISSFMSSHKCPELAKRFSDNIPKIVDEMLKRVDDYLRLEHKFAARVLERHTPYVPLQRPNQEFHRPKEVLTLDSLSSTPQEILATEHQLHLPQPAPLVGVPSKENLNRYCDYHNEKGHNTNDYFHLKRQLKIALESGKLNHLIKDVRQRGKGRQQKAKVINMVQCHSFDWKRKTIMTDEGWMNIPIIFSPVPARDLSEEALVVEAEVEGYLVQRIHIDEGALVEIMFKHCFNMLHPSIQSRLVETQTTVSGFSGEQVKPLGKIELDVCFGGSGRCRRAIMKFTVIPAPSPYNIILGHPGLKQLRAGKKQAVESSENVRTQDNIIPKEQVYVDDMVVKIKSEREMLADIAETFDNLRRINIKLNPKKCSFGVAEEKFLGYMVTSEGIRANPAKTKDIAEMQSPRTWGNAEPSRKVSGTKPLPLPVSGKVVALL
ncbi:hypothetical protein Tco_0320896 [Tanacetum coccineum]